MGHKMKIECKGVFSPEINPPALPEDPACCTVLMVADIGPYGEKAMDEFRFHVISHGYFLKHHDPEALLQGDEVSWGKNYLLVPRFSWEVVERMVSELTCNISASDWSGAVMELSYYMDWEFHGPQPG